MKRFLLLALCAVMLATALTGCGLVEGILGGRKQRDDRDAASSGNQVQTPQNTAPQQTPSFTLPQIQLGGNSGVVPASYGEQLVRSRNRLFPYELYDTTPEREVSKEGGYTYPLVFDEPLRMCEGFTVDYKIMEVVNDDMSGNYRYEVLVQNMDGKWKSGGLFDMDGYEGTFEVRLKERMSVQAVAVTCGKHGDLVYSFTMQVRDAICG